MSTVTTPPASGAPASGSEGAAPRDPNAVTLEVDGKKVTARKGEMIIQATDAAGIYVPRFCYHKQLSIAANCRMCLVDVEKAPKPLPACATPVAEGMVVRTRSPLAREAQKGVMEFLLINHPLDCPICDQGGECKLQDLAMGYGKDVSRYHEAKRIVKDKDIGPLIATEMTRCIHCTRCVRFGKELAGVMEFGGLGRGEHMEIRTFLDRSVDSELSGNVIDLCPVGALTSKPFRYTARPWELAARPSVSPHDCVGANTEVHVRRGDVMRVVPRENAAVNECWLADRDRFSYEALNADTRLTRPMVRRNGRWEETDWQTAMEFAAAGLRKVVAAHGAAQLGAWAAPTSTLEEFYLLGKFMRALGSGNVDHRLRQMDFSDDDAMPPFPTLGCSIADLERVDGALLVGSNLRKEQPLLNLRLRKAVRQGARVAIVNPIEFDFNYPVAHSIVADLMAMERTLAGVARALAAHKAVAVPGELTGVIGKGDASAEEQAIADMLASRAKPAVLLGSLALSHPHAAILKGIGQFIADTCGGTFGMLAPANSAAAWLAGCVPHRGVAGAAVAAGKNTCDMARAGLKGYVLLGVEPELDCLNGARAVGAMNAADFVVMLTSFKPSPHQSGAVEYADVWLPLASFAETEGTHVNAEGRAQSFGVAVNPKGDARPGWKILRVLANHLNLPGFDQMTIAEVRKEIPIESPQPVARLSRLPGAAKPDGMTLVAGQVMRIADVPPYAVDAITRRAPALLATSDNLPPAARLNAKQAGEFGLSEGEVARWIMQDGETRLPVVFDERVPGGCVLIASGYAETAPLGAHGPVSVVKEKA